MRKVKILKEGKWVDSTFQNVRTNDRVMLFEEDGTPVIENGKQIFVAGGSAYYNAQTGEWVCVLF